MKNALVVALSVLLLSFSGNAQDVVLVKNDIHTIISKKKTFIKTYKLLKIDNKSGLDASKIYISYNDMVKIVSVSVNIYNDKMYKIRSLQSKEIEDYKRYDGFFHTESRVKKIDAVNNTFPYFIEIEYVKEQKEYFVIDAWTPLGGYNVFCKESNYTLEVPSDVSVLYKFYNFNPEEQVIKNEQGKVFNWKVNNITKINLREMYSPELQFLYPKAIFLTEKVIYGGVEGKLTNWQDYGNWNSLAIEGADMLPEKEVLKIEEMVKDCSSEKEKVEILYTYLQDNTRYVNIMLNVGGLIPHNAEYVCNKKYGDCKALTNYMKSMLSAVGIESFYSLIRAGSNAPEFDTSFLSMPFNHVVLMVPFEKDTVWLECTSQKIPMGYWGEFTNGEVALVCDYKNSKLVKTPEFNHENNTVSLNADVHIEENHMIVNSACSFKGASFKKVYLFKRDQQSKNPTISFSNAIVDSVSYVYDNDLPFQIIENASFKVNNQIQRFGNNIIVEPFNKSDLNNISTNDYRSNDIWLSENVRKTDTVRYFFPEGYSVIDLPQNVSLLTDFGEFNMTYLNSDTCLIVVSDFKQNKGLYPKTKYSEFAVYITKIIQSKNQKLIFEKL